MKRFTLIEVLTVIAIGLVAATAMVSVVHNTMLFVRRANQGVWANQQMVLFRAAWRDWAADTSAENWRSTGDSFSAGAYKVEIAEGKLVLSTPDRTRQLALPKDATVSFSREEPAIAIMEISWPLYTGKSDARESLRIVYAESAK